MVTDDKTTADSAATKEVPTGKENQLLDGSHVSELRSVFRALDTDFLPYVHPLTDLRRKSLIRTGLKNHGFAEEAYHTAVENPGLIPGYLDMAQFTKDYKDFENRRELCDMAKQLAQTMEDGMLVAGDVFYRDALGFYNYVKEAARRGDANAEVVYKLLKPRFGTQGKRRSGGDEPTEKQVERDVRSLLHGTKEGEVVVRNVKPHSEGGEREVIDELKK